MNSITKAYRFTSPKEPLDFINLLVRISETDMINEAGQYAMNNSFRKIDYQTLTDFAERNWRSFVNIATLNPEYMNRGDWIDYPKIDLMI